MKSIIFSSEIVPESATQLNDSAKSVGSLNELYNVLTTQNPPENCILLLHNQNMSIPLHCYKQLKLEFPFLKITALINQDFSYSAYLELSRSGIDLTLFKRNFDFRELTKSFKNPQIHQKNKLFYLDFTQKVLYRESKIIQLSKKEFELLDYLLLNKNKVVTRQSINDAIWGYNDLVFTKTLEVHINKLRQKIDSGFKFKLIRTHYSKGYILRLPTTYF
jgi:DNA-binding winged helix-turn-helix (wHTH) protein